MATNNKRIKVSDLDFDAIKTNLKTFLRSQDKFKDYKGKNIVIIVGSARSKNNCPDQDGKTYKIVKEAIKDLPKGIKTEILAATDVIAMPAF